MPHDLIDRARIEHLKAKTARLIEATRWTIHECGETIERYRLRRRAEMQAVALRDDGPHEDHSARCLADQESTSATARVY